MQRVYGNVEDDLVPLIDADAVKEGVTRSKWISTAIEAHLHRNDAKESTQEVHLRASLDEQGQQITHLKQLLEVKDGEIQHLRELSTALTGKIIPALPPTQEEIKAKSWWQFWK